MDVLPGGIFCAAPCSLRQSLLKYVASDRDSSVLRSWSNAGVGCSGWAVYCRTLDESSTEL